jgi:hypothetical protein
MALQLDGGIERVDVEVGDHAPLGCHRSIVAPPADVAG